MRSRHRRPPAHRHTLLPLRTIAHAPAAPSDYCVVTTEVSKPRKQRQNRRIPDVCNTLGIRCIDTFTMLKELQFRTDWNRIR
ncbi:MAG: DUF4411 family protein [Lysobacterales bacterium]